MIVNSTIQASAANSAAASAAGGHLRSAVYKQIVSPKP